MLPCGPAGPLRQYPGSVCERFATSLHPKVQDAKVLAFKVANSWQFWHADLEQWICKQSRGTDMNREDD
jgi:hypothetical protein